MSKASINFLKNVGKNLTDFFLPQGMVSDPEAFTKMQLMALADKRTISKLLFYRSYIVDTESDLGFFGMHDGRVGIAFNVTPPVFLTDKTENVIINMLTAIVRDDTIVHISTLAGRDIDGMVERFKTTERIDRLKIKYPEKLREISDQKIKSLLS